MDADLLSTDFVGLSEPAQLDAAVAIEVQQARLDAARVRLYAAIAAGAAADEKHFVEDELCAALRLAPVTVAERMWLARKLTDLFPATLALLESGKISVRHARLLVDRTDGLSEAVAAKVEARVLERAPHQTAAAFGHAVRKAVASIDPRTNEEQHALAAEDRRVVVKPAGFGMAEIWALLPADGAATVMTALTAAAAIKTPGDDRTMDQKRADALIALAAQRLDDPDLPKWQGRRPRVQVTVAASTLLGLDDEPGDLDGYGPIPASMARAIAGDTTGTWRRLLTDPVGVLLDSSKTYRPPTDLAEFVRARDRTCRFPGCPRPARRADIDHQKQWEHGGQTVAENLECLCSRHHHLKHEAGWRVTGDPSGTLIWTSPTGHTYRSPPRPYD